MVAEKMKWRMMGKRRTMARPMEMTVGDGVRAASRRALRVSVVVILVVVAVAVVAKGKREKRKGKMGAMESRAQ